jgi:hypothetical protein
VEGRTSCSACSGNQINPRAGSSGCIKCPSRTRANAAKTKCLPI